MECRRLQAALDKEVKEHSKTKADLSSVQAALTAALSLGDSGRAKSDGTGSGTQMHQKRELLALRETNIDQAEQIQVSVRLQGAVIENKHKLSDIAVFLPIYFTSLNDVRARVLLYYRL
jgi:hypothetical protein